MAKNYDPQITIWMLTVLHYAQHKIRIRVNKVMLPPVSPHIHSIGPLQLTITTELGSKSRTGTRQTKEITV